jgi:hypothetical protein
MAKSRLNLVAPTEILRTVAPKRRPNAELRTREHLTPDEVETLMEPAKANRHGHRDATTILIAFRHGLRACETLRPASMASTASSHSRAESFAIGCELEKRLRDDNLVSGTSPRTHDKSEQALSRVKLSEGAAAIAKRRREARSRRLVPSNHRQLDRG